MTFLAASLEGEYLVYQFGDFELNTGEFRLSRKGVPVALDPKNPQVLSYLLENRAARIPGLRVVSRTSVMHDKGARESLPRIAQELGVPERTPRKPHREGLDDGPLWSRPVWRRAIRSAGTRYDAPC